MTEMLGTCIGVLGVISLVLITHYLFGDIGVLIVIGISLCAIWIGISGFISELKSEKK